VSEIAAIVYRADWVGVSREMSDPRPVGVGRAQSPLLSSPGEVHLRIGRHQSGRHFAAPIKLAADDGPRWVIAVLSLLDLFGPQRVETVLDGRPPSSEDAERSRQEQRTLGLHVAGNRKTFQLSRR
jgi:hypothetical protein